MSTQVATDVEVGFDGKSMLCDVDQEGVILFVNRKFVEMSGYTKEELLGSNINIFHHPDMPKCLFMKMWESLKQGESWKGYLKNLRKDGSFYWCVIYITPNEKGYSALYKKAESSRIKQVQEQYKNACEQETHGSSSDDIDIANLACEEILRKG